MSYAGNKRQGAISAYRSAAETVSPARAIVMLFDGAIQRIVYARVAIVERRIEDRYNAITKAYAILQGLQSQLDFEAGGAVAPMLARYYDYVLQRLALVNIKNDTAICDELLTILREMRESWAIIAAGNVPTMTVDQPPVGESVVLVG